MIMDIRDFYNISETIRIDETPVDENGVDCGLTSSRHLTRVQSQIIRIDKFRDFLRNHYRYAHNYKYMMDLDTFNMFCKDRGTEVTVVVPEELYVDGLQIIVISPYLKPGEIIAVPHHDYEEFKPMIYG